MKKNAMLKIAAILMVAVLLTTCAISSTFAKYTTSGSSTASARVAKWGVVVTTDITDMFAEEYADVTNTAPNALAATTIVAPGTENSISLTSVATGTPEVSVTISHTMEVTFSGFTANSNYNPIQFRINGGAWGTAAEAQTALAALSVTYAAGTNLANAKTMAAVGEAAAKDITIEWRWAFDSSVNSAINDEYDTALGNAAANAATDAAAPKVTVVVTTTIAQSAAAGDPYVAPAQGN